MSARAPVRIDGPTWLQLPPGEQERLVASGELDVDHCRGCGAVLEVWQREDADAATTWRCLSPRLAALFTRNPAQWRVILVLRGRECSAGRDHSQPRGEHPRAMATLSRLLDATYPVQADVADAEGAP